MKILIWIGLGGILGSISRYLLGQWIDKQIPFNYPWGTFSVNLIGCLLIGIFYGLSQKHGTMSEETRIFLTTGFCGSFTTFSALSLESIKLLQQGQFLTVGLYISLSLILGLGLTYVGVVIVR